MIADKMSEKTVIWRKDHIREGFDVSSIGKRPCFDNLYYFAKRDRLLSCLGKLGHAGMMRYALTKYY